MKYLKPKLATIGLALLASACSTMPNGKPFDGIDPKTGVSASLGDIQDCYAKGGVKVASAWGQAQQPPRQEVVCNN